MAPGTSTPTAARNVAAEYDFWPADRVRAAARAGVRLVVTGELATVTLDRAEKRNAMTPSMWWQLAQIGRALPPCVRAVLLCAEGPSFSAGLDRTMVTACICEAAVLRRMAPALKAVPGCCPAGILREKGW